MGCSGGHARLEVGGRGCKIEEHGGGTGRKQVVVLAPFAVHIWVLLDGAGIG